MKLLLCADIHGRKKSIELIGRKAKASDVDFIIIAGDMTVFERDLDSVLSALDKIGIPAIIIPGNHESPADLERDVLKFKNFIYLHNATYELDDYLFIGYGNPGFAIIDPAFEKFVGKVKKKMKDKKVILITHGPPHNTKLDYLYGDHVGCKSITRFIKENNNILIAVSGHLHENFGVKDRIGKAKLINPGPDGEFIEV